MLRMSEPQAYPLFSHFHERWRRLRFLPPKSGALCATMDQTIR